MITYVYLPIYIQMRSPLCIHFHVDTIIPICIISPNYVCGKAEKLIESHTHTQTHIHKHTHTHTHTLSQQRK